MNGRSVQEYLKERNEDLSPEERAVGEVKDPAFLVYVGLSRPCDMAVTDYLDNKQYVTERTPNITYCSFAPFLSAGRLRRSLKGEEPDGPGSSGGFKTPQPTPWQQQRDGPGGSLKPPPRGPLPSTTATTDHYYYPA
jgi:hypothetical protein